MRYRVEPAAGEVATNYFDEGPDELGDVVGVDVVAGDRGRRLPRTVARPV